MARIPVYEQQQTLPGESGAAKTPYVMDDAAEALKDTGKRMHWLSSDMKKLAMQEKEEREMAEFAHARATLLKQWGEKYTELQETGDFQTMKEEWLSFKNEAYTEVRGMISMKEAEQQFDIWAEEAGVRMDLDIAELVANRRRDDTRAKLSFAIDEAIRRLDIGEVKMLLGASTAYTEQEKAQLLMAAGKDIEARMVKDGIAADPFNYEIPDAEQFEYLDKDDLDALRQDQLTERNYIEMERNRQEEAIVGKFLDNYSKGILPSMSYLRQLHQPDPETGLRKISNSTFQMLTNLVKSKTASGGPAKPKMSTSETLKTFSAMQASFIDPDRTDFYAMELEVENAEEAGVITNAEKGILKDIISMRKNKENEADFNVLREQADKFGETLGDLEGYFDLKTRNAMARDFWSRGTSIAIMGKLNTTDAFDIGREVLGQYIKKMDFSDYNDIPRPIRKKWLDYIEESGLSSEEAVNEVRMLIEGASPENPASEFFQDAFDTEIMGRQ